MLLLSHFHQLFYARSSVLCGLWYSEYSEQIILPQILFLETERVCQVMVVLGFLLFLASFRSNHINFLQ